jgi:hypothetical protein
MAVARQRFGDTRSLCNEKPEESIASQRFAKTTFRINGKTDNNRGTVRDGDLYSVRLEVSSVLSWEWAGILRSSFVTVEEDTRSPVRNGASLWLWAVIIDCNCKEVPINAIIQSRNRYYDSRKPLIRDYMQLTRFCYTVEPPVNISIIFILSLLAEEVTHLTSSSGGATLESRLGHRLFWLKFSSFSSVSPSKY